MKNGIHIILGHILYVKNNRVMNGIRYERDGEQGPYRKAKTLDLYRYVEHIGWIRVTSMDVSSFRTACMRGTVKLA